MKRTENPYIWKNRDIPIFSGILGIFPRYAEAIGKT